MTKEVQKLKCPKCGKSRIYLDDHDKGWSNWKIGCNNCKYEDSRFFAEPMDAINFWMLNNHEELIQNLQESILRLRILCPTCGSEAKKIKNGFICNTDGWEYCP